ncbi:hypothetical protein [Aeromonas hydrophila]|uniref:hypothetical protein n=1 Tax=Aeromonas hydrophila TaxID=644 RepID=UPI00301A2B46
MAIIYIEVEQAEKGANHYASVYPSGLSKPSCFAKRFTRNKITRGLSDNLCDRCHKTDNQPKKLFLAPIKFTPAKRIKVVFYQILLTTLSHCGQGVADKHTAPPIAG